MSDDLVKQLKAVDHESVEDCFLQSPLFAKAAARIEAQEAEIARLKASSFAPDGKTWRQSLFEEAELRGSAEARADHLESALAKAVEVMKQIILKFDACDSQVVRHNAAWHYSRPRFRKGARQAMISPRAIEVGARALCAEQFGDEVIHGEARCCQLGGTGGCCVDELARQMKAVLTALAAEGMVVVPASDLRVVVDLARQADSNIETECIAEYLKDAAQPAEGEK
jgi:hypothetical protein